MWYLTDKGFKVVSINVFIDIKDDVVIRNKHTGKCKLENIQNGNYRPETQKNQRKKTRYV